MNIEPLFAPATTPDHNLGRALVEIRALVRRGEPGEANARARRYVNAYGGLARAADAMLAMATRQTTRRAANGRWVQPPRTAATNLHTVLAGELAVLSPEGKDLGALSHGSSHDLLEIWGGPRSGRGLRAWADCEVLELEAPTVRRFVLALPRLVAALDLASRKAWFDRHWPDGGPLAHLPIRTREALFARMDPVEFAAGEVIFEANQAVDHMLFLLEGWAIDPRRRVLPAGRALGILGKVGRSFVQLNARTPLRALRLAADEAAEVLAA